MRYRWISRGARQAHFDLWPRKPVLVRGDWRQVAESPKRYYSYETITEDVAKRLVRQLPGPGECKRL